MAFTFPAEKTDFTAENGVTYSWSGTHWRVKAYRLDDAALKDYATQDWTENKIENELVPYASKTYSDTEDSKLQLQIDELGITKGKVSRYSVKNNSGSPVSRPGELATNNSSPANITIMSFGTEDADNNLTKPMADDDIIEFVDAVSSEVTRYKIADASGAPTLVAVEYISGDNEFVVGEEEQVYIYPQNSVGSGVSKEYVDDHFLPLNGGVLAGHLTIGQNSNTYFNKADGTKQFEVRTNSGDYFTNIYSLNGGGIRVRAASDNSGSDYGTGFAIKKEDHSVGSNNYDWKTEINYLKNPTNPSHGANKYYVDEEIKRKLAEMIGSDGDSETPAPLLRPAMLSWVFEGADDPDAVTPSSGKFRLHTASNNNKYLRFSFNSANGCKIGDGKFDDTNVSFDYGPIGTIWEWMSGSVAKFKLKRQFRIGSWRWNYQISSSQDRHFEFKLTSSHGHNWDQLYVGVEYFISVGGFF